MAVSEVQPWYFLTCIGVGHPGILFDRDSRVWTNQKAHSPSPPHLPSAEFFKPGSNRDQIVLYAAHSMDGNITHLATQHPEKILVNRQGSCAENIWWSLPLSNDNSHHSLLGSPSYEATPKTAYVSADLEGRRRLSCKPASRYRDTIAHRMSLRQGCMI
jgi:hypothetical protein